MNSRNIRNWIAESLRNLLAGTQYRMSKDTAYRVLRDSSPTCSLDRRAFDAEWAELSKKIYGTSFLVTGPCRTKMWTQDIPGPQRGMGKKRKK